MNPEDVASATGDREGCSAAGAHGSGHDDPALPRHPIDRLHDIQADEQGFHPGAVDTNGLVTRSGQQRHRTQRQCQRAEHKDDFWGSHATSLWSLGNSDDD